MREAIIENRLKKFIESKNGKCLKFVSPGFTGVPDRICLLPGGKIIFVEVKAPGKRARPIQVKIHRILKDLGFQVLVIDSEEQINEISTT